MNTVHVNMKYSIGNTNIEKCYFIAVMYFRVAIIIMKSFQVIVQNYYSCKVQLSESLSTQLSHSSSSCIDSLSDSESEVVELRG